MPLPMSGKVFSRASSTRSTPGSTRAKP
jgi:hypothetical protein